MASSPSIKKQTPNWYPPWAPRLWNGMRVSDYFRLLRENRFKVHPLRYGMCFMVSGCAVMNSTLARVQNITHGTRIREATIKRPPVFVIGHWRSGTTLMHELLSLDSRFAFPSNFEAFIPSHFLVSRFFFYPLVKLIMPSKRPMDNMSFGVASPQEDDFALCTLGAPTPYRRIAFPNQPNRDHLDLNFNESSPETQQRLKDSLTHFLKTMTVRYDSQLVLKSPPHTGRIKQLAEWFPGAKFVHMSRHPNKLVPSTMRLWRLLDQIQGFQLPKYDDTWLKNYIFECKDLMYSAYLEQRHELPENQLIEVKFEDFLKDPIEGMKKVYCQLELDEFPEVQPAIKDYFQQRKGHKKNPFFLDPALEADIETNWREYMEAFGYV